MARLVEGTKARSWYHPDSPRSHGVFFAVSGLPGADYASPKGLPRRGSGENLTRSSPAGRSQLCGLLWDRRGSLCSVIAVLWDYSILFRAIQYRFYSSRSMFASPSETLPVKRNPAFS